MKSVLVLAPWLLVLCIAGCDGLQIEPVDVAGQPIIGHWYYEGIEREALEQRSIRAYLHVRRDGFAAYAYQACRSGEIASHSQLILDYLPIKRLNSKKMVLQKYPLTPSFQLTLGQWPDQGDGRFMVDEVPLQAIVATDVPDYRQWDCQ